MDQTSVELNYAQRKFPEGIGEFGDTKFKINKAAGRKCPLKTCNKVGCRKFWHEPCAAYSPGLVRQLWPMVLAVGVLEICLGAILTALVAVYRNEYDQIYGTVNSRIISHTSLIGLLALIICGVMLVVSLAFEKRKLMWIRIMISTSLGGYIVILSVLKVHFALLASERDPSLAGNISFVMNDACVLEVFTLIGSVIHFFGDVVVFTYYNLRFLHPTLFNSGQAAHV